MVGKGLPQTKMVFRGFPQKIYGRRKSGANLAKIFMRRFSMKKISLVLAAFATLLAFTACSDISGSGVSGTGENGLRRLTATVESPSGIALKTQSRSVARTIMSPLPTNGYGYYLYGMAVNGNKIHAWEEVILDADNKFSLNLESNAWELTLVACTAENAPEEGDDVDAVRSKAILIATTQVDLSRANAGTTFTLRPDGLTTPSSVNLKLDLAGTPKWTIPDSVKNVVCGIYSKKDGSIIAGTDAPDSKMEVTTAITNGAGFPTSFGDFTDVAPGTYLFKVFFCDKDDGVTPTANPDTLDPLGVWTDDIVVLPGIPNEETVTIPNVIGVKPEAPTNFTVYYTNADKETDGYYDAVFEWKDVADNEQYYEIEIVEYDGNATVAGLPANEEGNDWPDTDVTSTIYNPSEKNFKSGSLGSYASTSSPKVTIELELGKRYAARIRAKNRAGYSEKWACVTLKDGTNSATEGYFKGDVINLFRVRYYLQSGTYTPATGSATNGPISVYGTGGTDVVTYIVPDKKTDIVTTNTLVKSSNNWKEWRKTPSDPNTKIDTATTATYAGTGNQDLYAVYDSTASVGREDPNDFNILPGWVKVGKNTKTLGSGNTVEISTETDLEDDKSLVWTIAVPAAQDDGDGWPDGFKYDSIFITLTRGNDTILTTDAAKNVEPCDSATITIEKFNGMESGTYIATITAQTEYGKKESTIPVTVDFRNN